MLEFNHAGHARDFIREHTETNIEKMPNFDGIALVLKHKDDGADVVAALERLGIEKGDIELSDTKATIRGNQNLRIMVQNDFTFWRSHEYGGPFGANSRARG